MSSGRPTPPQTPAPQPRAAATAATSIRYLVEKAATEVLSRHLRSGSISPSNINLPPASDAELWSSESSAPGPNSTGPSTMNRHLVQPRYMATGEAQQQQPLNPWLPAPVYRPQTQPTPVPPPASDPEELPPNMIWTPWGHIVVRPLMTPLAAPNQHKLVSIVRSHQHGDATYKIETMAYNVSNAQIVRIREYKTANNVLLFTADGRIKDIPRTMPNLYPTSLLAWDMGISQDFRHIPEVVMHNSRPASNFYRPSYITFTRISCRPSNKRPRSPRPTPPPQRPCPVCTLQNHAIVAAAEDFAMTKATCINCAADHYFQVEAKPATVMSKRLFLRAIPTTRTSRVETKATCIKTGKDFSPMEVRDTAITIWELNQTTLSNLLLRYRSSPSSSGTSPPQSPPSSRTDIPPPRSSDKKPGRPRRQLWQSSDAARELSNQLRELAATDICRTTMLDPNLSTHAQVTESPRTVPRRYGLVTTTTEDALQALRSGTILKPTGMMPIITGPPTTVAQPTETKIAENTFVNHILPMRIDPESGYPEKVAGSEAVSVQRVLSGESPTGNAADITDSELMDIFGIKPIKQDHFSVLEAFTTVVRETETIPLTPPDVRKALVTHSGITFLPERLCASTAVTGRTKLPTLVCRPETRWSCSSSSRSVTSLD